MDINGDDVVDMVDVGWLTQIEGGLRDPVTLEAIPQLNPAITPESIMQYVGEIGPFMEGMDINGDGEVDILDSIKLMATKPRKV